MIIPSIFSNFRGCKGGKTWLYDISGCNIPASISYLNDLLCHRKVNVLLLTGKANQVRVDEHGHSPAYKYLLYLSKFDFDIEHMSGVAKNKRVISKDAFDNY